MTKKAFLIWGLVIIQLSVLETSLLMYLGLSEIIDLKANGGTIGLSQLFGPILFFGVALHLRFKEVGRRKRILALCMFLCLYSLTLTNAPATLYNDHFIMNSETHTRFWQTAFDWAKLEDPSSVSRWTTMQKIEYAALNMPAYYLTLWSLFALLWFGSLDPRTPSKNRFVQFMKTEFLRMTFRCKYEDA